MDMNIYLLGGYYLWVEEMAACGVQGCELMKWSVRHWCNLGDTSAPLSTPDSLIIGI